MLPKIDPKVAAQAEMASRVLSKRRLLPFIQRMNDQYEAGWVHEDICRRLEKFSEDVANKKSPRLMLLMPPRHGKQLWDGTLVPTPTGWTTHGDLDAGDYVFHPSGRPVKVLAVSGKTPSNVKVTLANGEVVYCHENHEWTVYSRAKGGWVTVSTEYLLRPARAKASRLGASRATYQLPVAAPLQYSGSDFTVHPYVLGAWLGDGSAGKACITGAASDSAVTDKIQSLGYPVSAVCIHNTTGVLTTYFSGPHPNVRGRLTQELQALGIYKAKRIPAEYQRLNVALRLELLAGLVDTDGHTDKKGRVTFTAANRRLTDDVVELCEGLGFRPYTQEVQPKLSSSGIQGKKVYWTVGFQPTLRIPVALDRKQPAKLAPQRRVGVVSVERVTGDKQGNCIQVDSLDGLYVVGNKMTVTHNSEIASRSFPAWHLGRYPDHEFIACSYNMDLATDFSRKVRQILEDPSYQNVFPGTKLDPDNRSAEKWVVHGKRGSYVAAGTSGGITGRGAHILVVDDPIKSAEDADSADNREKLWQWYLSTAYSRLAPGAGVLLIQTTWHDSDLAGHLQSLMRTGSDDQYIDQFSVVKYPAIAEADEYLNHTTDLIEYDAPPEDPHTLLRRKGEALHPARYDLDKLLRIKAQNKGGRWWSALYQQNPVPDDGGYFEKSQFKRGLAPSHKRCNVFIAWDFAISEKKHNDYTVGTVGLQDDNDVLHIVDQVRFKSGDAFFIVDSILTLASKWYSPSLQLGFEDGQIYRSLEALLKKRMRERRVYPSITVLKPLTDKLTRARALQGRMQQGMVSFTDQGDWFEHTRQEMLRFPAGAHDDIIDSMSWLTHLVVGREPPAKPKQQKVTSWADRLSFGATGSFMSA